MRIVRFREQITQTQGRVPSFCITIPLSCQGSCRSVTGCVGNVFYIFRTIHSRATATLWITYSILKHWHAHESLLRMTFCFLHSSKASILQHSAFFTIQLSHPYMTTGKTIALTRRTFVGHNENLVVWLEKNKFLKMLTGLRARRWCQSPELLHMISLKAWLQLGLGTAVLAWLHPFPHYPLCTTLGIKTTLENKVRALFTETWSPHVTLSLKFWLSLHLERGTRHAC